MELFWVHLKIFRSNENRVGIIENFQMKTPERIRGYLDRKLFSNREVSLAVFDFTNDGIVFD